MKTDTPVVEFMTIAWKNAGGDPHSWVEFNQALRSVYHIAARRFPWKKGDIDEINKLGKLGYVLGECGYEGIYSAAVEANNVSAYTEIERYITRRPIIADDVDNRKRGRLCVGSRFSWNGEDVYVTSFNNHGKATCCSYSWTEKDGRMGRKLKHRYTVGADDIKADRKARRNGSKS